MRYLVRLVKRPLAFAFIFLVICYLKFAFKMIDLDSNEENLKINMIMRGLLGKAVSTSSSSSTTTSIDDIIAQLGNAQPAIDRSPKMRGEDLQNKLQSEIPNLPVLYWKQKNYERKKILNNNSTCVKYPDLYDLHFNNKYWQTTETSDGTFFFYGAYLDIRKNNRLGPTVRILGMINRLEPKVKTYCQLWFNDEDGPVFSKVLEYKYIWYNKWGNYKHGIFQPYLLACRIPKTHFNKEPASVSVVEHTCDVATNNLRVLYNKPENDEKEKFAVCVKGLDFPEDDLSVKLVEWIELLSALGADKIFFYNLDVHPNITKVLDYYSKQGTIDVTPLTLAGYQPNLPMVQHMYLQNKLVNKRQNELIPYNDCLYRNIYRYEYIALLDIDEVIVPIKHQNWADMMENVLDEASKVKNMTRASWNFRNVYFMDDMLEANEKENFTDIPPFMHMMQHVYRSANYTKPGQYVKCFHNPEKVLILHNHFPLGCLGGVCTSYPVNMETGHLQHYRKDCVNTLRKSCKEHFKSKSVKDATVWRWKDPVISRTSRTLRTLGFFPNQ